MIDETVESLEEETTEEVIQESLNNSIIYNPLAVDETIESVDGFKVEKVNRTFSLRSYSPSSGNVWSLSDGTETFDVLFPETEHLKVQDGYIVNTGTSNITGVVLDGDIVLSEYFDRMVTILPLYSSASQNTAFRYGAHGYMTSYRGGGSSLTTTVTYNDFEVVKRPFGFGISMGDMVIIGLLFFSVIVSIIGGLVRR